MNMAHDHFNFSAAQITILILKSGNTCISQFILNQLAFLLVISDSVELTDMGILMYRDIAI